MLLSILTSHDDCRLPCIMGFDPSEKEKYRWNQFFVPIRAVEDHEGFWVYKSNYKTTDIIDMIILNDINLTFIYVSRHWGKNPLSYTLYGEIQHQIGTGVTMQSSPAIGELVNNPYLKQYHPSKILSGYGSPDQILLYNSPFIDDSMHSREYGMGLILIYEKQNFMVAYSFPRRLVNDQYIGCPQNAIYIYISTWAPDVNPTPVQMLDDFSGGYINPDFIDLYKPIEQVTLWNVEEFTTIFGDEKLEMCITTPMEPWALEPIN